MYNLSSIDKSELKKFNKTKQEWWNPNGSFKMLHKINPIRIKYIQSQIIEHFNLTESNIRLIKNIKLLDVGSGGGLVCKPMYDFGADVTGLDANENNIKAAIEYANEYNLKIKYVCSTIEHYVQNYMAKYDVILCLEVIEHVANLKEFLRNICKLLNNNGILIFSTINRTIKSFVQAIIIAEYILGWVPKKTHLYSNFIKPSELVSMLLEVRSLHLHELKGLKLSLLNNVWELTNDVDVNYFAVFKGLKN